ncbi:MAG TPA: serine protease [Ignavibacteria bacterium]|nr:serine protease [Ignavibacteria bacterium]
MLKKTIIIFFISLFPFKILFGQLQLEMTISEQIANSTIYLEFSNETVSKESIIKGFCTGIVFMFNINNEFYHYILTNKHNIEGFNKVSFYLTKVKDKKPDYGNMQKFTYDFDETDWIKHPDGDVDLAIYPINNLVELNFGPQKYVIISFAENSIPNDSIINSLSFIENVYVVGYPKQQWDYVNNIPVIRKGVTSSPYKLNYRGREEFLVDAPNFKGNSGSPIIIYDNEHVDNKGNYIIGRRTYLLGINYYTYLYEELGMVKIENIDSIKSKIPSNLHVVIKSQKILDFIEVIKEKNKDLKRN